MPAWRWLLAGLMPAGATAGEVLDRIQRGSELRVCVWPDYYGISYRNPKTRQFTGLDIDLSAEFARELGARLHHVDSSFTSLSAVAYAVLVIAGGAAGRNWLDVVIANGVTSGHWGKTGLTNPGGVGTQSPGFVPEVYVTVSKAPSLVRAARI